MTYVKGLKRWGIWPNSQLYARQIVYNLVGAERFSRKGEKVSGESYGFWKRRLGDQGRRETRAWLVLPFARTSTVLRLSRKSPDVSSLWNGKKNNSCLVSPLLSKRWGVNFLQSWRERRENPKHTCGQNTYLRLSLWLPHSMAAASKSKGTKRQPGGADIACCDQVFQY